MDKKVIRNARSNHSKLKDTNLTWHMLEMLPRLFLAGLGDPTVDKNNDYRFSLRSLKNLMQGWFDDLDELQDQLEEAMDGGYMTKDEIKEMKQDHKQQLRTLREQKNKMESRILFLEEKVSGAGKRYVDQRQHFEKQLHTAYQKIAEAEEPEPDA
jgi:ElaB/YqjD/DUF883 family membrane-anchored ribosome-binding protein